MQRDTYSLPDMGNWTRWDEIKQRVGNCRRMLQFAWIGLTTDSTMFCIVFVNSARDLGDGLIAATLKDGTKIDPDKIAN